MADEKCLVHENRLTTLEAKLISLDGKIGSVETKLTGFETISLSRFDSLRTAQDAILAGLTTLREKLLGNGVDGLVQGLDRRISEVELRDRWDERVEEEVSRRTEVIARATAHYPGGMAPTDDMGRRERLRYEWEFTPLWVKILGALIAGQVTVGLGPDGMKWLAEAIHGIQRLIGGGP